MAKAADCSNYHQFQKYNAVQSKPKKQGWKREKLKRKEVKEGGGGEKRARIDKMQNWALEEQHEGSLQERRQKSRLCQLTKSRNNNWHNTVLKGRVRNTK